jgi:hypothetical protein
MRVRTVSGYCNAEFSQKPLYHVEIELRVVSQAGFVLRSKSCKHSIRLNKPAHDSVFVPSESLHREDETPCSRMPCWPQRNTIQQDER